MFEFLPSDASKTAKMFLHWLKITFWGMHCMTVRNQVMRRNNFYFLYLLLLMNILLEFLIWMRLFFIILVLDWQRWLCDGCYRHKDGHVEPLSYINPSLWLHWGWSYGLCAWFQAWNRSMALSSDQRSQWHACCFHSVCPHESQPCFLDADDHKIQR